MNSEEAERGSNSDESNSLTSSRGDLSERLDLVHRSTESSIDSDKIKIKSEEELEESKRSFVVARCQSQLPRFQQ
jgi:hypothetical protein